MRDGTGLREQESQAGKETESKRRTALEKKEKDNLLREDRGCMAGRVGDKAVVLYFRMASLEHNGAFLPLYSERRQASKQASKRERGGDLEGGKLEDQRISYVGLFGPRSMLADIEQVAKCICY